MLAKDEIVRRLLALIKMPPAERPITLYALAALSGLERKRLYYIAGLERVPSLKHIDIGADGMQDSTQKALSIVFERLEQGRVDAPKGRLGRGRVPAPRITPEGQPPCQQIRRFRFDEKGFRIERTYENPLRFPPK